MELKQIIKEELYRVAKEKEVLGDILNTGRVNEGVDFNAVLQKVKGYAAKGILTATVLAGLMSNPSFSQQQKQQIKTAAAVEQPTQHHVSINPAVRAEWNQFIDWIGQTYPGGISDAGADPTAQIVGAYKKVNPNSPIDASNVKDFQQALKDYNEKWKQLQPNYHPEGSTLSAPSPVDNRIGSITSKMKFPVVAFEVNGQMVNFGTDIDRALVAFQQNQDNTPYIDPNLTPAQRFQHNQELRAQGKRIPTMGDMQRARASASTNSVVGTSTNSLASNK